MRHMRHMRHMRMTRRLLGLLPAAALIPFTVTAAFAHDPGLSSLEILLEPGSFEARVTLSVADARFAGDLERLSADAVVEMSVAGAAVTADVPRVSRAADGVRITIGGSCPAGAAVRVSAPILRLLPAGHRQYLAVRTSGGYVCGEAILDARHPSVEIPLGGALRSFGRPGPQLARFILLGLEHILTGWDHLAFLFALLLVGPSLRDAAKVITSFTLAHSITLALGVFDLVRVSPAVVEPLIAASVLYVGLENLLRRTPGRRWPLTFAFGLVHGLGFASVLRDLGIAGSAASAVLPLGGFNLGVEAGQLAVAALVLPLARALTRPAAGPEAAQTTTRAARWWVPAGSTAVSAFGAFWLIQRLLVR